VVEARKYSGLAVDTLVELTKNTHTDSTRYAAATALLDRGYGRPAQSLDLHLSADAITKRLSDIIPGDQLRTIVERIEHIEKEISELNEGKREIYQEAKSNGFDPKALREIVRLRKQDQKEREEHESLLEVYLRAISGSVSKAA
jgi:uncharacterized protein (UPF0335 family)